MQKLLPKRRVQKNTRPDHFVIRSNIPKPPVHVFYRTESLVSRSCRVVDTLCHAGSEAPGIGGVAVFGRAGIGISVPFHFGQDLDSESDMIQ